MRFWVPLTSAEEIVAVFGERLKTASFPGPVMMVVRPGEQAFAVTMRAGRTSVLSFTVTGHEGGATVTLVDQVVSRSHEMFRRDVAEWIYWHARSLGGGEK